MANFTKEIIVNAPIDKVFQFWKNFENFPRFMENIESITVIGPELTHWKMKGPLGVPVEWDAKTLTVDEEKKISWQSTEGTIETHGAAVFKSVDEGRTHITVGLEYKAPLGVLGETVAKILNDPAKQLEEDLMRFKKVVQEGKDEFATGATPATGSGPADHTAEAVA